MTAIQERAVKDEMIELLEQMDGRDALMLLNLAKRFYDYDFDRLTEQDLKDLEETEAEFARGEFLTMEI